MVKRSPNIAWIQRGFALLWNSNGFSLGDRDLEHVTLHQFLTRDEPVNSLRVGQQLVVTGLEACLDVLTPADAERWVEEDLHRALLYFQDRYETQVPLVLWMPGSARRIDYDGFEDHLRWRFGGGPEAPVLDLGRLLFRGAVRDALWIREDGVDLSPDGTSTYGAWLERIS
jgi:hypothetical protein